MRLAPHPALAGLAMMLTMPAMPAVACGIAQTASDTLTISTGSDTPCAGAQLRAELKQAIDIAEVASAAGRGGGGSGRQGAYANQQRTTGSTLYKMGTAPSVAPPPTRMVMPGALR